MMNHRSTQTMHDFRPDEVDFNFKQGDNNQKRVYINRNENVKQTVKLQLCALDPSAMMRAPFGVSEPMPGAVSDPSRQTVELAVEDPIVAEKLKALNEKCIQYAVRESVKCFGKSLSEDSVRDRFTSPFREVEAEGRSDLLRMKIPVDTCQLLAMNEYNTEAKDIKCEKSTTSIIRSGSRVVPVVDISALWFVSGGNQFGYSMVATNLIVDNTGEPGSSGGGGSAFVMQDGVSLVIEDDE